MIYSRSDILTEVQCDWTRNDIANFSGRGYRLNSKIYVLTLMISEWIIEL